MVSVKLTILASDNNSWKNSCVLNVLISLLSCILMLLLGILILVVYFFIGCPLELIKYYLYSKTEKEKDIETHNYDRANEYTSNRNLRLSNKNESNPKDQIGCKEYFICFILLIVGTLLQPLYLMFYILVALMHFYRKWAWWYFYI